MNVPFVPYNTSTTCGPRLICYILAVGAVVVFFMLMSLLFLSTLCFNDFCLEVP